jgi:glutamyl-tRNA reductase
MIKSAMHERPNQPMFFIDLAVPRDIESQVANIPNVFLYNLDDLAEIANENLNSRIAEIDGCRQILRERAERLWSGLEHNGITH